jgi:uncharacterized membrane protein
MPIHPMIVHFPIAFYFLELVLLLFWLGKKDEAFRRFALFTFRLGFLFMIAAAVSGYFDAGAKFPPVKAVRPHFYAASAVFIFYTLRAAYWQWAKEGKLYRPVLLWGALLGNGLVALAGFLGGKLVYGH